MSDSPKDDTRVSSHRHVGPVSFHNALSNVVDAYGLALAEQEAAIQARDVQIKILRAEVARLSQFEPR